MLNKQKRTSNMYIFSFFEMKNSTCTLTLSLESMCVTFGRETQFYATKPVTSTRIVLFMYSNTFVLKYIHMHKCPAQLSPSLLFYEIRLNLAKKINCHKHIKICDN